MHYLNLAKYLAAAAFFCCVHSASAQETTSGPVDPRAAKLAQAAPETYVSEANYAPEWFKTDFKNVVWERRVFRTIDLRDSRNGVLAQVSARSPFENLLVRGAAAILGGANPKSCAYAYFEDDRFSKRLSDDALKALVFFGPQTEAPVMKFRVKEVWMYLAKEQMLVCRITGIAPIREIVTADGVTTEEPLFWVYYPAIRQFLRERHLTGVEAKDLDEFFETRQYVAPIEKTQDATWPNLKNDPGYLITDPTIKLFFR